MNVKNFFRAQIKSYESLPFEMRIFVSSMLFIIVAFLRFIEGVKFLITAPFRLFTPSRTKHGQKKKNHKKQITVIFPLPFWVKVRFFLLGSIFSCIFFFLPLLVVIFLQDLPNPEELTLRQIPQTTKIYDRNNTLLYEIYANQNRTLISLNDVPMHLQKATIAIEDKNFYQHPGFDISSIIRAVRENSGGRILTGGSTITQQLIKSSLLTPEQSWQRKVKEIILAFWAERMYSKQQILEMYFNQVPYGGTAWGVEAASEIYFGKSVKEVTLAESAFLAGLTSAPSTYSPYGLTPTLWKARQKEVLQKMTSLGFISKKQAEEALATPLAFRSQRLPIHAPHFVMYVREQLINKYGLATVEKGGLIVKTSLDLALQEKSQQIVKEEVDKDAYLNLTNGATLVTNPENGDILAMVGSKDFYDENGGAVNVTTSLRQPGSTVKVITYSAALSQGFTAASMLDDSKTTFQIAGSTSYTPVNYDGKYYGRVPLRFALANSLNLPAVKTLNSIGVPTMLTLGKNMGITSWKEPENYGLSLTLGAAEATMVDMATVFGTLANSGDKVTLNPILKITDFKGHVLEEKTTPNRQRVLDPGVAFIISDILADNQTRAAAFGPNSELVIPGKKVSVKTGTSDNKRDNWTIGYTKNVLVAVWVGNNDNSPMSQTLASGITGAAPIWHNVITELLKDTSENSTIPENIIQKNCFGRSEYFLTGTEANCAASPIRYPSPGR